MQEQSKIIRLKAFSGLGWHNVDLDKKTCDCPDFETAAYCKHLNALGIYVFRPFTPKTHPTFSQALSGLVKSLRIRRVEEAVYWLLYFDTFPDAHQRFRVSLLRAKNGLDSGVHFSGAAAPHRDCGRRTRQHSGSNRRDVRGQAGWSHRQRLFRPQGGRVPIRAVPRHA